MLGSAADYRRGDAPAEPKPRPRPSSQRGAYRAQQRALDAAAEESAAPSKKPPRRGLAPAARGKFLTRARERGCEQMAPLDWIRDDYAAAHLALAGPSRALAALAALPRCYAQRVERAALGRVRDERGFAVATRSLDSIVARRIVAAAVVMWRASKTSRRRGHARIVVGRTRGMLAALFQNPQRARSVSVSTLFATSHGAHRRGEWDCGAIVALQRSGALWAHQPPAACASPAFVGRDRNGIARAFNEYHITERAASDEADEPDEQPEPERRAVEPIDERAAAPP